MRIDRLAGIGRIATGVVHEINNPLALVGESVGGAGMVVGDAKGLSLEDRKELEKATKEITAQAKRCRGITHQLLGFVRDSEHSKTEFEVHELVNETINFLKPEIKHSSIEFDIRFMPGSLHMNSDPKLLEQAIVNLVTNTIHAVREKHGDKGHILIRTLKTDSEVEIRFADNSAGIPMENQQMIFELFYSKKTRARGRVLGSRSVRR